MLLNRRWTPVPLKKTFLEENLTRAQNITGSIVMLKKTYCKCILSVRNVWREIRHNSIENDKKWPDDNGKLSQMTRWRHGHTKYITYHEFLKLHIDYLFFWHRYIQGDRFKLYAVIHIELDVWRPTTKTPTKLLFTRHDVGLG